MNLRLLDTLRTPVYCVLIAACLSGPAQAESIHRIEVLDVRGNALPGAVVSLTSAEPGMPEKPRPAAGVMDQIDRQFSPHILVVQRGATVAFPNSDSIKHHVYSFSEAMTFEIRLYKDRPAAPIEFSQAGEVELGCNVHDWMLGYIYVVDTPYFTRTDKDGRAELLVPDGAYTLQVWHPRIDTPASSYERAVQPGEEQLSVVLPQALLPPYDPGAAAEFDDYD